ncbi:MAG: hypothetical protein ACO3DQ_10330, partial [Cephaloticoccus sp.]
MDIDPGSNEETSQPAMKPARTRTRSAKPRGRAKAEAADAPEASSSAPDTPAASAPPRDEPRAESAGSDDVPTSYRAEPDGSGNEDSDSGSNQGGNQGHQSRHDHPGGGEGGHDQGRGGWKRNKRKRGRHGNGGGGGNWQQGGGNKGPAHPQQPGPAAPAMVSGDLPPASRFEDLVALDALAAEISSGVDDPVYLDEIYALNLADLNAFARQCGATFEGTLNKAQLLTHIFKAT